MDKKMGAQGVPEDEAPESAPAADDASQDELEKKLRELEAAERAVDAAFSTGKADRAKITQAAQLDAAEAVALAGVAMEADEAADEAMRIAVIAEGSRDRARIRDARRAERAARKQARRDHREATRAAKRAYDAVKFSAPGKLGFMRFVQVVFALHIAFVLLMLVLTSRDAVSYSYSNVFDWIVIILEGVAFWFFINCYKIARPFVIGMALLELAVTNGIALAMGTFHVGTAIVNSVFDVFLLAYFIFSRRARMVLVNDLSKRTGEFELGKFKVNRHGWPFIRNLVMYFIVFSVLGHWMEMGLCQFIILGLVQGDYDPTNTMLWRDWLYPFPMEGAAVVLIALILYPLKEWLVKKIKLPVVPYVVSFIANALMCSLIEFSMGLLVNADYQLWDYRANFGNIMGQVCLQNTLAFGVAASVIAWFVYPLLEKWIARVPRDVMNIVFVVVLVFGGIIWSLYIVEPPSSDFDTGYTNDAVNEQSQKETDRQTLGSLIDIQENFAQQIREELASADYLTDEERAQLEQQLSDALESIRQMRETLGTENSGATSAYIVATP